MMAPPVLGTPVKPQQLTIPLPQSDGCDFVKSPAPVLVIAVVILFLLACGCTMNAPGKTGPGNLSGNAQDTQTQVTIAPTGTGDTEPPSPTIPVETIQSKMMTIVPTGLTTPVTAIPTTLGNLCVFGSGNCHFYEQCMQGCISGGTSQTDCDKKICCSSKCMDLPTSDEKTACANECLTGATGTTVPTLVPLSSPTETLAPLETPTLIPL
jgi:hypothetical protein